MNASLETKQNTKGAFVRFVLPHRFGIGAGGAVWFWFWPCFYDGFSDGDIVLLCYFQVGAIGFDDGDFLADGLG